MITRREVHNRIPASTGGMASSQALGLETDGPVMRALEGLDEFWIASDAYIYGYPLVTMEMTRRIMTNVASPTGYARSDGAVRQGARISRPPPSATSRRPTPTRSTPSPGSISAKSPGCSASPR